MKPVLHGLAVVLAVLALWGVARYYSAPPEPQESTESALYRIRLLRELGSSRNRGHLPTREWEEELRRSHPEITDDMIRREMLSRDPKYNNPYKDHPSCPK